jgi:uncharacterized iron-regulated membrane protein
LLPDGTRVLVQRLVAKPEHNGKRARVVSFDARTGRYAVALDDGKELSLKAECVAALHMNVSLESKKWIFIGIVALIVLAAAGIAVLLVANSRSRRAANKHFDF